MGRESLDKLVTRACESQGWREGTPQRRTLEQAHHLLKSHRERGDFRKKLENLIEHPKCHEPGAEQIIRSIQQVKE